MSDDRGTWIRHFLYLALFAAAFHSLQFLASLLLWVNTSSPVLMAYGVDAAVSAFAALVLAARLERDWRNKFIAYGYMLAAALSFYLGASMLWIGRRPRTSILGIVLAAVSMLVIPIVGSYMKVLAVELRSQALKSAAIFTFGNSYLSMVLLTALLVSYGMNLRWGDPLGALVMFPFMAQKGIQILLEEGKHEYVED
ncbi:MAG TPA: cation transporter [Terriglobia bacterium]|jgi:divalent metal cation (Fe/Co/Zn/Cd) transporter